MNRFKIIPFKLINIFTLSMIMMLSVFIIACSTDNDSKDDDFVFAKDVAASYTRVDRIGMPAVATALITTANKDPYNAANPSDDVASTFVGDIVGTIEALHNGLDDDLTALSLTPCTTSNCVAFAAPLVLPDTLSINTSTAAGFPNGRKLEDAVIDITLAVLLLDISGGTHEATDLVGALNPAANDATFLPEFPYVAPAN